VRRANIVFSSIGEWGGETIWVMGWGKITIFLITRLDAINGIHEGVFPFGGSQEGASREDETSEEENM